MDWWNGSLCCSMNSVENVELPIILGRSVVHNITVTLP